MSAASNRPVFGVLEWLRPGEEERVERLLADLKAIGATELRTGISWADWHTDGGQDWYAWLLPRLAKKVDVLPCFHYTPPTLGIAPNICSPPRDPKQYADFLDVFITRFGEHFDWVELWNKPKNPLEWDTTLDPNWLIFCEMVGGAAHWAQKRGKKTVLGASGPMDAQWVRLMCDRGVLQYIDAVGIHGFPGTFEFWWDGWNAKIARVRNVLLQHGSKAEIWITETGYSTWRHDERAQIAAFANVMAAPAERVYWYAAHDIEPAQAIDAVYADEREFHFGLRHADGSEKLLMRLLRQGGVDAVDNLPWAPAAATKPRARKSRKPPVMITGGSGFLGCNLAHRFCSDGQPVLLYDNLSRAGVEQNAAWLRETHGDLVQVQVADIRDAQALGDAAQRSCAVYHLAAQVAVTSSLTGPINDFEINARGTLNLLEALRGMSNPPPIVFTSTNKVYGSLDDVALRLNKHRYEPDDEQIRANGIGENQPLDFYSPYGCSKGAADQYILDYARTFGLPAVVFRMSCIYGPHQFGTEDQGWVAHFLIQAMNKRPITLYGDGKQVRDVLFVEDLVDALLLARKNIRTLSGQVFNLGGGAQNTTSLLELLDVIGELDGKKPRVSWGNWRPGDQRYYVSNFSKFQTATGWKPKVGMREGVGRLHAWLREFRAAAAARESLATA
ncbi:MAG TPA: NAD-dependent epimerase/dehydratase family protein [Chthoniobacterales bacterium]|nr:NAD-dependent epimerase/dehydratase family protein [Chthoniobacterales bacterium]